MIDKFPVLIVYDYVVRQIADGCRLAALADGLARLKPYILIPGGVGFPNEHISPFF